jgi:hypothetical protein
MGTNIEERVSEVLSWWDPIGVKEFGDPETEYERYIPEIVSLIEDGLDEEQLYAELERIEQEEMGLSGRCQRTRKAAKKLARISV